jgi:hypothetical protein
VKEEMNEKLFPRRVLFYVLRVHAGKTSLARLLTIARNAFSVIMSLNLLLSALRVLLGVIRSWVREKLHVNDGYACSVGKYGDGNDAIVTWLYRYNLVFSLRYYAYEELDRES